MGFLLLVFFFFAFIFFPSSNAGAKDLFCPFDIILYVYNTIYY